MADCSNLINTSSVTFTKGTLPSGFCHSTLQTTYDKFIDITTAALTGATYVTTDDTPPAGDRDKAWLKQGEPSANCMPVGWYIYDTNMGTTGGWRNFMSTPAGAMTMFGGGSAPEGWLLCDGTAYSTATNPEYEDLFAVIANVYGGSDGTDFKVPDLRGRTVIGAGTGSGLTARSAGTTGGAETHTLAESEIPAHTHTFDKIVDDWRNDDGGGSDHHIVWAYPAESESTGSTGGGGAHENMSPFLVANYLIKY